jgi:hypothetical protein
MSHMNVAIREQAAVVAKASSEDRKDAERELLRLLGLAMKNEGSSFDATHGCAQVMEATQDHHEVRVLLGGGWRIGSAPEEDLLRTWAAAHRPALADLLSAIQKKFSSAKIGSLVDDVKRELGE